ncbi:MAG: hypothetical protein WCK33_07040 [Phycisphaerae bacterium]
MEQTSPQADESTSQHLGRVIAVVFALCGFALAAVSGLLASNPAGDVVLRSIIAMFVCNLVGHGAARCISHVLDEHVAGYKRARPIPEVRQDDE